MADLDLTLTIPDGKVAKAKEGFLAECPKPAGFSGTDKEWFQEVLRRLINPIIRRGLQKLAVVAAETEDDYTTRP